MLNPYSDRMEAADHEGNLALFVALAAIIIPIWCLSELAQSVRRWWKSC